MASKDTQHVGVFLAGKLLSVDKRIWKLFETKAGDKKQSLCILAEEYLKEGKSVERALADALDKFKLTR